MKSRWDLEFGREWIDMLTESILVGIAWLIRGGINVAVGRAVSGGGIPPRLFKIIQIDYIQIIVIQTETTHC